MPVPSVCFLNIDGKEEGPISFGEVILRLGRGEIQLTDYMFNETLKDWIPLLEVPAIQEHLRAKKPAAPPQNLKTAAATQFTKFATAQPTMLASVRDWFVLKWDTRIGPFSTADLVHMLQEKSVFEFEFIWKQGMDVWKRIADIEDFQANKIRQLFGSEKTEIFIPREHPRVSFQHSFLAHDGNQLWQGHGHQVSIGGARVRMDYAALLPGQVITLHVKGSRDLESFNVQSEVVGKKYQAGHLDRFTAVEYVVKFIGIEERLKANLKSWIAKQAA